MILYRNDLIDALSKKGYTKKDAGVILSDVFDTITEALANGNTVQIHGFGTFEVRNISERETSSISTSERITIPAYKSPKFTAGKFLKRAVKEGFVRAT